MTDNFVEKCVALAVKNSEFISYEIERMEANNKGEGYTGDNIFLTVEGVTKNGQKTLHLVAKTSKESEELRKQVPMRKLFLKEIYIYKDVKTTFEKFQRDKGLDHQIRFMPYCYTTIVDANREALVFEDLKTQGFELWDKSSPMTIKHVSLVLEAYGQWHALSMALKTQQPDVFGKLVENNVNVFVCVLNEMNLDATIIKAFCNIRDLLHVDYDLEVLDFHADDIMYALHRMYIEEPEYHVILHEDCWNNNFLFKTPNDPSQVQILDWQVSGLGSPIFDLSYFLFCNTDTGKHQDVKELLEIYYGSFSRHLISYGCDPGEVFFFNKLLEHWKKFSRFGFFIGCFVLQVILQPEIPDMEETANRGGQVSTQFDVLLDENKHHSPCFNRIKNNWLFYTKNVNVC